MAYQICPLCKGEGKINDNTCTVCKGKKIISESTGLPPVEDVIDWGKKFPSPTIPSYPTWPSYPQSPILYCLELQ